MLEAKKPAIRRNEEKPKGAGLRRAANKAKEGASPAKSYTFPASANDDQVDALTQALRRLYPLFNKLKITQEALNKAMGRG